MMNDKEVSNVLALSHSQPVPSSWMFVDKRRQVIEFVLDDPQLAGIATPQLSISDLLFLDPNSWRTFYSSCR